MANLRLCATALAAVVLAGFLVFQLLEIVQNYNQPPNLRVEQTPPWRNRLGDAADNGTFLLGVGKADITG